MNTRFTFLTVGLMAFCTMLTRAQTGTSAADPDPELDKIHAYKESLKQREASASPTTLSKHEGRSDAASSGSEEKERHRISGSAGSANPRNQSLSADERKARIDILEKKKREALAAGSREEAEKIERMIRELVEN